MCQSIRVHVLRVIAKLFKNLTGGTPDVPGGNVIMQEEGWGSTIAFTFR